jgi:hypothetical protein
VICSEENDQGGVLFVVSRPGDDGGGVGRGAGVRQQARKIGGCRAGHGHGVAGA